MHQFTDGIRAEVRDRFTDSARLLSFQEYLDEIARSPYERLRTAVQYCADMLEHFGRDEVESIGTKRSRYRIFDAPFGGDPVYGQEQVQEQLARCVEGFAEDGWPDKLIMLTGPNGSSKSSLIDLIFRGLEAYSRTAEGALYRFNWVFPNRSFVAESIGFGDNSGTSTGGSFAHLRQKEIQAKLFCELKDHPILLLPREARHELLEQLRENNEFKREVRALLEDELCAKCRTIYDALLDDASGDWAAVIQHVQVQRFTISRRYRRGAVTIEPQSNVDASTRQVTADRSLSNLPTSLQNLNLVEPTGDLIDASSGAIEYSDLLKRSTEANKYLLTTCEKRTISLPGFMAYLNLVMFATSNEKQLDVFKQDRIFTSFRGRMEIIQAPYLLELSKEERIYERFWQRAVRKRHVAPGSSRAAAMWAVLTRLNRPNPDNYETEHKGGVARLTPIEKLWLYERQEAPQRLPADARRRLRATLPQLRSEYAGSVHYEGRNGISPREIAALLAEVAANRQYSCICPQAVIDELEELIKNSSLYDFLQIEPNGGYHDVQAFIADVRKDALTRIDRDLSDAVGLVSEGEYDRRFDRYFAHLKAATRGEKVRNPSSGELEDPDEGMMQSMEELFGIAEDEDRGSFRRDFLMRIGAWVHEHTNIDVAKHYREIFEDLFRTMRRKIREDNDTRIRQIRVALLKLDTNEAANLAAPLHAAAEKAQRFLTEERGYCKRCAKEAIVYLERHEGELPRD